eukprot:m.239897 g.239897  ORF g.239897 m.239897 type:complete len:584 (-) comp13565_c0_seq1:267-2018(-)
MIVRVRGPSGMVRIEFDAAKPVSALYKEVGEKLGLSVFELRKENVLLRVSSSPLSSYKIAHGDILTVSSSDSPAPADTPAESLPPLDEVDVALENDPGLVVRSRDTQFCHHGDRQQCIHCCPLEPYDDAVQSNPKRPIKFMSFHTYLRKLNKGVDKGKFTNLESISCQIIPNCPAHAPWPAGICTKCQPSAVVLRRQTYRHVDYVEFETTTAVNEFVQAWRATGQQRAGWLYGRYDKYDAVPLGIKAVVVAIYEPPQQGAPNGLHLLDDPNLGAVDNVANALGLQKIGWIFTDLLPADPKSGKVQCTRHIEDSTRSAMFTATEIMMAARLQRAHPNRVPSRVARSGFFGSKFVSIVVTGNAEGDIGMKAYQVSDQGVALERDDVILPASKGPGFMFVRSSTATQYVPEVSYVGKDKYNNEVSHAARPEFPVEYLLVDFECGTKVDASRDSATLQGPARAFPPANRSAGVQTLGALNTHLRQPDSFLCRMSDFNLLVYLATDPSLGVVRNDLPALFQAVRAKDAAVAESFRKSDSWNTLALTAASADGATTAAHAVAQWQCRICTLLNPVDRSACEACGTAKGR